jgi:hypothetical protein
MIPPTVPPTILLILIPSGVFFHLTLSHQLYLLVIVGERLLLGLYCQIDEGGSGYGG